MQANTFMYGLPISIALVKISPNFWIILFFIDRIMHTFLQAVEEKKKYLFYFYKIQNKTIISAL